MAKYIGRLVNVGFGKEASRGVGVAASYWVPKAAVSFDDKVTKAKSALSYGTINGMGNQSLVAQKWAEGSIEGDVLDESFGLLMLALFGSVSSASFNGAYKHTYSLQEDNQHQSLSMYLDDPVDSLLFELAMINSMELSVVPEDVLKFTADFMSKSSAGSVETAAYTAENKFLGRHLSLKLASLTSGLDAAASISAKELTLTVEKNTLLDQVLGTVQPEDVLNQQFIVSGEITLDMENRTYANLMLDGTYQALRIDFVNSDVTIGSTNPSFRLDLSRVEFDEWEPTRDNDEVVSQTVQFTAMWDITNGTVVNDAYVINEVASY